MQELSVCTYQTALSRVIVGTCDQHTRYPRRPVSPAPECQARWTKEQKSHHLSLFIRTEFNRCKAVSQKVFFDVTEDHTTTVIQRDRSLGFSRKALRDPFQYISAIQTGRSWKITVKAEVDLSQLASWGLCETGRAVHKLQIEKISNEIIIRWDPLCN